MKSSGLIVVSRPITPTTSAYLMLEDNKSFNPAFYNTTKISQKQAIYVAHNLESDSLKMG